MLKELLEIFAEDGAKPVTDRATKASTRSAGAQPEEGGRAHGERSKTKASRSTEASDAGTQVLNIRMRSAVMAAIAQAVEQSPIEFATVSDFVRHAVQQELQRRGLVKVYR
jgi:hypothetical protein